MPLCRQTRIHFEKQSNISGWYGEEKPLRFHLLIHLSATQWEVYTVSVPWTALKRGLFSVYGEHFLRRLVGSGMVFSFPGMEKTREAHWLPFTDFKEVWMYLVNQGKRLEKSW